MRRPQPPTRSEIAAWWASPAGASESFDAHEIAHDGEPRCMACGYRAKGWRRWDTSTLERAHVVAHSAGGSNEPSNFVLLCHECHARAPMTTDRATMLGWCARHESHEMVLAREVASELHALGVSTERAAEAVSVERLRAALDEIGAGTHLGDQGARLTAATVAAAVMRLLR